MPDIAVLPRSAGAGGHAGGDASAARLGGLKLERVELGGRFDALDKSGERLELMLDARLAGLPGCRRQRQGAARGKSTPSS